MRIGILECGPTLPDIAARHGSYRDIFAKLLAGPDRVFPSWSVYQSDLPHDPDAADAWVLTGSRYGAYEDHAFIEPLEEFIRAARTAGRPMVGICFGHQIMAQALGGHVEKFAGGWGFGLQDYAVEGLGKVSLSAIHQDQVMRAPDGAHVIASNPFCAIAGLQYGDWGLSLQPHPEFDQGLMADYLDARERANDGDPKLIAQARDGLTRPHDSARVADWLGTFLEAAPGHPLHPANHRDHDAASAPRQGHTQNG